MMEEQRYIFGPFLLDAGAGLLYRRGVPVPIGYRAMLLLERLLRSAGTVVGKDELIDAAWRGLAVEEGNLSVQIAGLRKVLGEGPEGTSSSEGSHSIVSVSRVGYRLVGDVRPQASEARNGAELEAGPSIAVTRFRAIGDDPDKAYFADGLSEDIITGLSRLRGLHVRDRSASFAYDPRHIELDRLHRELKVRYVLQGSVRQSGHALRITASLSDASVGTQVWAERFDIEVGDFLALQDQITHKVMASIEPQLYEAERLRLHSRPAESLDAWGFVMKAMPHVWTWGSQKDLDIAEGLLVRALDIDPDYARANSLLAWTTGARAALGLTPKPRELLASALARAQAAVVRDQDDPWAHLSAGYVHMVSRNFRPAVDELLEAIDRNPSLSLAHCILGSTYGYGDMAEDGLHHLAIATRLSPRDFTQAAIFSTMGICHFTAGRFDVAASLERRAIQLRPAFGTAWRTYASTAALAGDTATATMALGEARRLQPNLSVAWIEEHHPIVKPEKRALYTSGLRIAGLS
ncbi:winged helix-turn-helix domain-containing protein [Mesorhizobium sp. WSM3224]|uniref:winged helix-turn-helix domain-containing tetratricopeptide repeat protein n=1 Tax=Mesorhizobium sp. WSM3224 TaxID=1040986 RepID=UPI000420CF81|nr:winged helix-turn-helix domain-containing protein [Mesorhizobium sp. WSM3224]